MIGKFAWLLAALLFAPDADAAGLQVVGALAREASLAPGESSDGTIALRNTSAEPLSVRVYARDYSFAADGSNEFLAPGSLPRSNAGWITWSPEEVFLPPGAVAEVAYVMTAPDGAQPGTWWSTLMIEPAPDAPEAGATTGLTVRTVVRYAVQLVTEVGRPEAALAFVGERLSREGTTATLHVDVSNPGDRMLKPGLTVQVHDERGASVGTFAADAMRIYPGCSVGYAVRLEGLPAGRYEALVIADAGEEVLFGAHTAIDLSALAPIVSLAP